MNRPAEDPQERSAETPVELADELAFSLDHLQIVPAALTVSSGSWSQRLERRAMQVLVVLAQASPAVASRHVLNARVWGGRIVGEDAVNRAVQTLRRMAADAPAPPPFEIETIPRIGYRLTASVTATGASAIARDQPAMPDTAPSSRRKTWAVALAALVGILVLASWLYLHRDRPPLPSATIITAAALDDVPPGASDVVLSADGRNLAYRDRDAQGHERIFTRPAQSGDPGSPVSPEGMDAHYPAWSPDGKMLAFAVYDAGRPCRIFIVRLGEAAVSQGNCETNRDPRLAWSADGKSLLLGDAPGWNAVPRITAVRIGDGQRAVLSSPPGDSMGDDFPVGRGKDVVFQRQFRWADEGWVARDLASGRERLLWRRRGVTGSVATPLSDGRLVIAWTRAGASRLDFVAPDGRVTSQPVALGPVTAISAAQKRLLVETDRRESALVRPGEGKSPPSLLASVRGNIAGPAILPHGRMRFPAMSAGTARLWERDVRGTLRPWGNFAAARISGLTVSPDGRFVAAIVTGTMGREVVTFDPRGRPVFRWNPHARSVNAAAWSADGRRLIVPVIDGAGWRLFEVDPFAGVPPRDMGLPGFALVQARGRALYAVRAGETTSSRELWRLDGGARRLPLDVTLFDIVNWYATDEGIWTPDRSDRDHPALELRDPANGRRLRHVAAPGLAGAGSGLTADSQGPVYVQTSRNTLEYTVLALADGG